MCLISCENVRLQITVIAIETAHCFKKETESNVPQTFGKVAHERCHDCAFSKKKTFLIVTLILIWFPQSSC